MGLRVSIVQTSDVMAMLDDRNNAILTEKGCCLVLEGAIRHVGWRTNQFPIVLVVKLDR